MAAQAAVTGFRCLLRGMEDEVRGAAAACRAPAARFACQNRRVAAAIDEDEALLAALQALGDRRQYRRGKAVVARVLAQVDRAHDGERGAGRGPLGELEPLVAALPEVVPALE